MLMIKPKITVGFILSGNYAQRIQSKKHRQRGRLSGDSCKHFYFGNDLAMVIGSIIALISEDSNNILDEGAGHFGY